MPDVRAISLKERFRGCLLGLACGDAVGTTAEFGERGAAPRITGMHGGGPFRLQPGRWTDDTSMALCLGTSLAERGGFDARDQAARYLRWAREGYLSSTGRCFDIGATVATALLGFERTGEPFSGPTGPNTAGNGCLMRLAPIAMYFYPDLAAAARQGAESARVTHGAPECLDACRCLGAMLCRALAGAPKDQVFDAGLPAECGLHESAIMWVARGSWREKPESEICSGGYVVESLEAALWCFDRAESFEEAVLAAANLGGDADTTAAITGQLAGAYWGERAIPAEWLATLYQAEEIGELAERLLPGRRV